MRSIALYIVFLVLLSPSMANSRFEGSPAGSVSIKVADELAKDALRRVYMRGMALGYDPGYYNLEKGVLELTRRERQGSWNLNLYIRIEVDMSVSPPLLKMYGEDMGYTGEEWQIMEDMKTIRDAVKKCCAAR